MIGIRATKDRVSIIVWRRQSWTSMPHLYYHDDESDVNMSRCGRIVELLEKGVDSIVITSLDAPLFLAVGCGHCRIILVRDLHKELLTAMPDAKERLKKILAKMTWKVPDELTADVVAGRR